MAAAAAKPNSKKKTSDSSIFQDADEHVVERFPRIHLRQALKRGSFVSICYPYKFAYYLVKFGYIPKSIAQYSTEGGKRLLRVPSVKEYMDFMKTDEGELLWMRGEISFCITYVLYGLVEDCMAEFLKIGSMPEKSLTKEYCESLYVTSLSVFVAVAVTHPFIVLSYRQIGQYIGKEDIYSSAPEFISVFTKPGISLFLEGMLARYVLTVLPTLVGDCVGRTWDSWLEARCTFLPRPERFLRVTRKGTNLEWLRPTLHWFIEVSAYYWVTVALSPLEKASVLSCIWDSGIKIGSEPFVATTGHFVQRFVTMWKDGRLFRPFSFYSPHFTPNTDAFVVL